MTKGMTNRWKGFVLGALGGVAGIFAMRYYWKAVTEITGEDPRKSAEAPEGEHTLDDVSLIGKHHEKGESSTAALGRIAYHALTGKDPSPETKTALSYIIHWVISAWTGGVYGALRGPAGWPDLLGGMALAVGLWGMGDEVFMPLTGLTKGPTAYPAKLHAHALGAHVAYGLATAAATQTLQKLA